MTIPHKIYLTLGVSLWLSMLSFLGLFVAVAVHALHIPQGQWAGSDSIEIFAYLGLMWIMQGAGKA